MFLFVLRLCLQRSKIFICSWPFCFSRVAFLIFYGLLATCNKMTYSSASLFCVDSFHSSQPKMTNCFIKMTHFKIVSNPSYLLLFATRPKDHLHPEVEKCHNFLLKNLLFYFNIIFCNLTYYIQRVDDCSFIVHISKLQWLDLDNLL